MTERSSAADRLANPDAVLTLGRFFEIGELAASNRDYRPSM